MKKLYLTVLAVFILVAHSLAQSGTSNIGTEFWTAWMDHIDGAGGATGSEMVLYIASDVATSGTVSSADGSYSGTFTVTPGQVTLYQIPTSSFLGNVDGIQTKGIHITSLAPIAVYAHIYASAVSGATLLLPVNTLANIYTSLNYTQLSNSTPSYSLFMVIGTVDNTTVQITPSAALIDGSSPGKAFTVVLNKGQVYQGISNSDLTGTQIVSVNTGAGCQKIAVFSGSNKIYIGNPNKTSDNLFQQLYPTASWGKTYITAPLKNRNYDVIRIVQSDPTGVVTLDGNTLSASSFTNGLTYDFNSTTTHVITSTKPIQVVQYAVTQSNGINGTTVTEPYGDPEMIYLNPLEQNIDHVTLYSTDRYLIKASFINVVIPTAAVSSFLLDGVAVGGFSVVPGNTAYSYAQYSVASPATHTISASQGFNAIAYGFGVAESYGYAAGTNVKNLNEYVQYNNPTTSQVSTSGCVGTPLEPQVVLPYQTTSLTWNLGNGSTPVVQTNPTVKSTFVKNGVTLYLYDYGTTVNYAAGTYAIAVTAVDPITTLCGSNDEVDLSFTVANPPTAAFSSRDTLCVNDTIGFTDHSTGNGSAISAWHYDFGNGDTSILQNPVYTYLKPGDYTVAQTVSILTGCQSVFLKKIHVRALPVAAFSYSAIDCQSIGLTLTDQSTTAEGKIIQWLWNYGDGTTETRTTNVPFTHTYAAAGTYKATLTVITDKGCNSASVTNTIVIHPSPVAAFGLPDVCLVNSTAQFTDKSSITDGTAAQFTYLWNFGDASATATNANTSTLKNPVHQYITAGTYTISETVTSVNGCAVTTTNTYTVSGQANFTAAATACPADTVMFTDKTDGTNKIVSAWHWNFGTGNAADTSSLQNPSFAFKTAGTYNVTLTVSGHNGCSTTSFTKSIHINQKPTANFNFSSPTCETKTVTFTDASLANEGAITSWLWNFGDGTTSTLQNPTHVFSPYSTYIVSLTVSTSVGCTSAIFSKQVVVNRQPVASFVLPDVCAADGKATFIANPDKDAISYTWFFGNTLADIASGNVKILTGATVILPVNAAGQYYAKLTVLTASGCTTDTTKQYTVNGAPPTAAFDVPSGTLCSSKEVDFVDKAYVPAGFNNGAVTSVNIYYNYSADKTTYTHYEQPTYGMLLRHLYPLETTSPHTYTVYMVAYSGATCFSTYSATVTVQPVPVVTFSALPNLCQNAGAIKLASYITTSGPAGTPNFYLDASTSPLSGGILDPSVTALGQHTVTFIYTSNSTGCADTLKQTVTIAPVPTGVSAGTDQEVLLGESVTLHGSVSGSGSFTYLWTPSAGLSDPTSLTPVATPTADTKYTLTVTSTVNGIMCPASDSVTVRLLRQPIAPNTFTPNGDGINDTWQVLYLDQYPGCTVKIYNRSGEMVYSSVGYAIPWDGTYRNNVLPVGTYYYIIDPKHNNIKVISGSVNLIK